MIEHEPSIVSPAEQTQRQQRGLRLKAVERPYSNQQLLRWNKLTGDVEGASNPRGIGQMLRFSPWPDSKTPLD